LAKRILRSFPQCLTRVTNMNSTVITILSLSVSGSLLALLLLAGKPLLKNRVSKAFSYYIWILVMLRLVLPVAAPVNAMGTLFNIEQPSMNSAPAERTYIPARTETDRIGAPSNAQPVMPEQINNEAVHTQTNTDTQWPLEFWNFIKNNLLWIWLLGAAASLGWFITAYLCFSRRIRRSCVTPHSDDLAVFEHMRGGRSVTMACSSLVSTPVLIGVYRPAIVLPQLAYVRNGMGEELKYILRHELTHYRRKDVLYKWLVAAVTSLHWFNPFMLWIRREINRACEFSCDEAVISGMSADEKQSYGNTLLALSANRKLSAGVLATTLCEDKKELKERLISIMKYKKKSTWAVALALVLALLLTGCAVALGAANSSGNQNWMNAELSLSENGEPLMRYHEQDEWVTIGAPIAAPKEWSSDSEIESRQEAQTLSYSPQTSMALVSANDGWLAATYGNGVANADTYIYRTHDGGKTWNETTQIKEAMWYPNQVLFLDNQHAIVAIGLFVDAPIFQTSDGGMTWTQIELPLDAGVWEAQSLSVEQNVITLTVADRSSNNDGMIEALSSEDGGTTWQRIEPDVLSLVENFGKALKAVTLTAPQDVAAESIKEHYSEYVTPELLAKWQSDPQNAPGRALSSPWPDRIEITGIMPTNDGEYTVSGEIIEVTSTELANGGAAAKYPVTLIITKQGDQWLISGVTILDESDTELNTADNKPAILETVNEQLDTDVAFTNGWRSALVERDVNGGKYIIVQVGSLKSDPEQGVAVVCHQNKDSEQYVIDDQFLTPSKHGAIKIESLGAKGFNMSVVAEDGYTWIFNVYNGFQAGANTEPDSQPVSTAAISNLDWVWPVKGYDTVTSAFGKRVHPITGTTEFSDHIDIAGNGVEGAAVYAALSGTVSKAEFDNEQGNYIVIDHDNGIETIYRHLDELKVSAGDPVAAGDTIGTVGSTGKVTGACLAFSVYVDGNAVNPTDYLR